MNEMLHPDTQAVSGGEGFPGPSLADQRQIERMWADLLAALDAQTPGTPGHLG